MSSTKNKEAIPQATRRTRTIAEWTSFGVSVLILIGFAGFLGVKSLQKEKRFFAVEAKPLLDQVQERDGKFILPVRVAHPEGRTFAKLVVALKTTSEKTGSASREIEFDYLAENADQTVFVYLNENPANLKVEVAPLYYTLE